MIVSFVCEGRAGSVEATVERVDDSAAIGQTAEARGFPCLTARVAYTGRGYDAMFGWVQSVRSTDDAAGSAVFAMDPFVLFPDSRSPYCYFGLAPTLFDSPVARMAVRQDREEYPLPQTRPPDGDRDQ
ncbi:hypothetical protein B4N89_45365 [Embleya scabrispora]|uniref:Uncharacterized protein n=1 Tax=Embleya scabrispora TaxID=159449 RepID=A0A1T3NIQ6_9ACTN|nr:hypothetical protein [Embleya scabrispora]OPC76719.1 hypothetical protein B4N89_45365 [Embleya scabrispora]